VRPHAEEGEEPEQDDDGRAAISADPRRLPLTGEYTCVQVIALSSVKRPSLRWERYSISRR